MSEAESDQQPDAPEGQPESSDRGSDHRGDPFFDSIREVEVPELAEVLGWVGDRLDEIGGAAVGKVEGVFSDPKTGDPTWLLTRMGRFGHYSVVPFSHAVAGAGRVWIPYDRAQIRSAPQIEPEVEMTREDELRMCAHFEIPETTGRAQEVSRRTPASITSVRA